jgi:hypothetical protein
LLDNGRLGGLGPLLRIDLHLDDPVWLLDGRRNVRLLLLLILMRLLLLLSKLLYPPSFGHSSGLRLSAMMLRKVFLRRSQMVE